MLAEDSSVSNVAMSEQSGSLRLEIDNIEIKDTEYFPRFKCIQNESFVQNIKLY